MLKNNIIEHSTSEYSFPVVLVKKKNGEFRFAIDYRRRRARHYYVITREK
jgi:hypothetical protein